VAPAAAGRIPAASGPGIKLIEGVTAQPDDVEYGFSRGRLLPRHTLLGPDRIPAAARERLQESLVLVHGGMAQNVGPILEMVTENTCCAARRSGPRGIRPLPRSMRFSASSPREKCRRWAARSPPILRPAPDHHPWVSNLYTERLIQRTQAAFGDDFWGFWMLGGMSGGGMGFIFAPTRRREAQERLQEIMLTAKRELETALPFAMDPVVYDFAINEHGSVAALLTDADALLPAGYYQQSVPRCLPAGGAQPHAARTHRLAAIHPSRAPSAGIRCRAADLARPAVAVSDRRVGYRSSRHLVG